MIKINKTIILSHFTLVHIYRWTYCLSIPYYPYASELLNDNDQKRQFSKSNLMYSWAHFLLRNTSSIFLD